MNIGENFHPSIPPQAFGFIRMMWPTHNPERIADHLNARYSLCGSLALSGRAIENMHRHIVRLDREAAEG